VSALRAMAAALDDAALEGLAPRGLVRRALADVAAGRAAVISESEAAAELAVDGETVRLTSAGPGTGGCSCPAPGVCRHRLAGLILLRVPAEAAEPQAEAAPEAESVDWAAVVAAFTPERLARYAGKAGWAEALAEPETLAAAEVRRERGALHVRLGAEAPVVFLATGGLEAALTQAPQRRRKAHVARAALAARHALGIIEALPAEAPEAADARPAALMADARTLAAVRDLVVRMYRAALAFAPVGLEEEARRLALTGRVEALPRLSAALRRLAGQMGALRRREAEADPEALLAGMAEVFALAVALDAAPVGPEARLLAGVARQDYEPAGDLVVYGLGAQQWSTPGGAHGVTAYFHEPATGRTLSLSQARPDCKDPTFTPHQAFRHHPLLGSTLEKLCAARVDVADALVSATGRLSSSQKVRARATPWRPDRAAIRGWPCVAADWLELETYLAARESGRLAGPPSVETPVVLEFTRYAPLRFDELTQTLIWPVADRQDRWIGLTLPYEGHWRGRIESLERLAQKRLFWAILALAQREGDRIELRPYALWGERQFLLDFNPESRPDGMLSRGLIDRLRAQLGATRSGPAGFAPTTTATDRLADRAWTTLVRRAEAGRSGSAEAFASKARDLAREFDAAGLAPLARPFAALDRSPQGEAACLRAAWAVLSLKSARVRLAWMG
jgi:hypothetical protein